MSKSNPQFFPNANNLILNNVSVQNVQGNYYNGVDPDWIELNSMVYASNAGYNATKQCLPGTRVDILDDLENWALGKKPQTPPMVWLSGSAGTGKSCIAHTIALRLDRTGNLGSFFAFDNSYLSEKRHEKVFSTIARDLAARNVGFKKALAEALRNKSWLRSTDIIQQWEMLVVQPAVHLQNEGPILMVIEALDESGDSDSRAHLLDILGCRLKELPPNIRILLTSRPLDDISEPLEGSPTTLCTYMHDIPRSDTQHDIHMYITAQLARVGGSFFDRSRVQVLVNLAEGLFQWAFVACQFIKGTGKISNPKKQYNILISSSGTTGMTKLDSLYETVLRSIVDDDSIDIFRSVMGQVLGVFEPLSINALAELRDHFPPSDVVNDGEDISLVLRHMGPLLSGIPNPCTPIRPLHSSFLDYLTNKARSKDFHIDNLIHSRDLALASLEVMQTCLCFNICQLETSYLLNSDVPDLQERIHKYISPGLRYACQYWARHVHDTTFDLHASDFVRHLLYNNFLYWVEVLSLLQRVTVASHALSLIMTWAQSHKEGKDIVDFSYDAQRFIRMFGGAVTQSTPHLYLSALPFAPKDSLVSQKYAERFPGTVRVASGLMSNWPPCQNVLRGHQARVLCSVLSPDDSLIVSGSADTTVRVWDAETGETVLGPFLAHSDEITSVSFSLDGRVIASASKDCTIRIWDARTGKPVGEPLVHTNAVECVVFDSGSTHIISGSFDKLIRVWDVETGKEVCEALTGHSAHVTCLAVSPDGKHFISGSDDCTLRAWKTGPYENVGDPFEGHSNRVTCVVYTMDGTRVISGSRDKSIRIWDAETGVTVIGPCCGHIAPVTSVALSPDNTRIVSGSNDQTMYIWDAHTGQAIVDAIAGHTDWIYTVAFSRDGKRFISGSRDNTIRIWDVDISTKARTKRIEKHKCWIESITISPDGRRIVSGASELDTPIRIWDMEERVIDLSPGAFEGHTHFVWCVAYSPDGKSIVSSSADKTLRIWNAETGEHLLGPLTGHTSRVSSAVFSYDGKYIFSSSRMDGTLRVWDSHTGIEIGSPLPSFTGCIAASPNSYLVAAGSQQTHEICIFDAVQGVQLGSGLRGHTADFTCMSFLPDGKRIISGSRDHAIIVWDAQTGAILMTLYCNKRSKYPCYPECLAVSPDGRFIIAGLHDDSIRIWDAEDGSTVAEPFTGHTAPVRGIAVSMDGKYIISGSEDQAIRVWDIQLGKHKSLNESGNTVQDQRASSDCIVQFSTKAEHALKNKDILFEGFDFSAVYWKNSIEVDTNTGWIIGPQGRRLLWAPHDHLTGLVTHRTKKIFSAEVTELDLSNFAHGRLWTTCFRDSGD